MVLPPDLVAFGAQRREEPGAACRGKKPGKIENLDPLQRERLVVQRREARVLDLTRACGHARAPPFVWIGRFAEHRLGVLAQERRPAADLPAGLAAEPFAGRVGERTPELRMLDLGKGLAYPPVLVERVLMRLAQRRPQQPGILRLAPRHILVGPGADKALHDVEHVRAGLVASG